MAKVSVVGVSMFYGEAPDEVHALRGVNMEARPGELTVIAGRSGSGKSTLLTLVAGLESPHEGAIFIDDVDVVAASRDERADLRARRIGIVHQDHNLISSLTLLENVALPREIRGAGWSEAAREAQVLLDRLDVAHLADRFPDQVSGGQRQRAAIARAMIGERSVILADEPTGALDRETGRLVLLELQRAADDGATVLVATHDREIMAEADSLWVIDDGRLSVGRAVV